MNNKIKKSLVIAAAAMIVTLNSAVALAATPVPAKGGNGTTTQTEATQAPTSNTTTTTTESTAKTTVKATTKPTAAATAKATTKPTEVATSKPKSTTAATVKPTSTALASSDPSASPEATPIDDSTVNSSSPLVFSEQSDDTTGNIVTTVDETSANENRYTTKGGSFGWFILSVIINAIISFIIGNRFYKMGRRDTHVLAEIRALKKDIDAKMQYNIGGFSEYETVISNSNKSYAKDEEGLKSEDEIKAEELATEIYRKWENQVIAAKERETRTHQSESRRTSASSRNRSKATQRKNNSGLSGKVKDFINDVFPFDKD